MQARNPRGRIAGRMLALIAALALSAGSAFADARSKVVILATGGTIAGAGATAANSATY